MDAKKKKSTWQGNSLAAHLTRWHKLIGAVQRNLKDLAHAAEHNTRLEKLLDDILQASAEQRALTYRLRILVRERDEKIRQARDLRSRLAGAVIGKYGIYSDKLREFGLRPRGRGRKMVPRKEVCTAS
jgi:hypothetical protein